MTHSKISIIVPCYNEEKIIDASYKEIKEEISKITSHYEIIFANDGSTDNTKKNLKSIAAKDKKTKLISWGKNKGMGYTHRNLYKVAKGNVIIEMAADLSIKPAIFRDFLRYIRNYDVVIASRYKGVKGKIPLYRKIPSRIYYLIYRILFGIREKDITSGFMAFRKNALENIKLKSNGFEIHIELMLKLKKQGYKIIEIPAYYVHREKGTKFSVIKDGPYILYKSIILLFDKNNLF